MDVVDEAAHPAVAEQVRIPGRLVPRPPQLAASPVVLRRRRDDESPASLEPPLRDSTSHLTSGALGSPSKLRPSSVIASKNTRKRMEDRHVVLHDVKAYLPSNLQSKVALTN
jgi:hypothetical protein